MVIVDDWPLADEVRHWKGAISCLLGEVVHLGAEVVVGARVSHCEVYGVESKICVIC